MRKIITSRIEPLPLFRSDAPSLVGDWRLAPGDDEDRLKPKSFFRSFECLVLLCFALSLAAFAHVVLHGEKAKIHHALDVWRIEAAQRPESLDVVADGFRAFSVESAGRPDLLARSKRELEELLAQDDEARPLASGRQYERRIVVEGDAAVVQCSTQPDRLGFSSVTTRIRLARANGEWEISSVAIRRQGQRNFRMPGWSPGRSARDIQPRRAKGERKKPDAIWSLRQNLSRLSRASLTPRFIQRPWRVCHRLLEPLTKTAQAIRKLA